jgi:uridine nucleosidase
MIPINVTHTTIVTKPREAQLLSPSVKFSQGALLPAPSTPLRHMLSSLVTCLAQRNKVFGFVDGPPLHDPNTIAYVVRPEIFTGQRQRVDVELHGEHTLGETVVDVWHYRTCDDSWGLNGKNCIVTESVNVRSHISPHSTQKLKSGCRRKSFLQCCSNASPNAMQFPP